jgi:ATPase subunit of ABC transporter with duplicated ATPase domains
VPRVDFLRNCEVIRTSRVMQLEGMFELPPAERAQREWSVYLPLADRDWQIGLIVGPSGSGKSTILTELFGGATVTPTWHPQKSIIDCFDQTLSLAEITGTLSSVGFSSPPSWLRPYDTLSTGERFRVDVARQLLENGRPGGHR